MKKPILLPALFFLPFSWLTQTTEGDWTYLIEVGGTTITASTANVALTGKLTAPARFIPINP